MSYFSKTVFRNFYSEIVFRQVFVEKEADPEWKIILADGVQFCRDAFENKQSWCILLIDQP